jgi:HK97 gp10 family phage protein
MARSVNQTFRKLPELKAEIALLVRDIAGDARKAGAAIKEVARDAAEVIRVEAKQRAPVKTGALRRAIFADRGDPRKASAIVGVNHEIAPHGQLVEFGHAGPHPAGPQPFMRPAIQANRAKVREIFADGIAGIVKKYR